MKKIEIGPYISYDEIIRRLDGVGIIVTWRTLNYYKSLGLLPKSLRIEGDKKGYYPNWIITILKEYYFLQNHMGLTLSDIKRLLKSFQVDMSTEESNNICAVLTVISIGYAYFLDGAGKMLQKRMQTKVPVMAADTILWVNQYFRKALLGEGGASINKFMPTKGSAVNSREVAEKWADGIVKQIILSMRGSWEFEKE